MIFTRSTPRHYADYHAYRPFLLNDFEHLCAYCLRHEAHMGGAANSVIDHRCPVTVCPDRETDYTNLYLACSECNTLKGDAWPSPNAQVRGYQFLDPCQEDHDAHWQILPTGEIIALTPVGSYTIDKCRLDREELVYHRRKLHQIRRKAMQIVTLLGDPRITAEERQAYGERLAEYDDFLHPPVFAKAKRSKTVY